MFDPPRIKSNLIILMREGGGARCRAAEKAREIQKHFRPVCLQVRGRTGVTNVRTNMPV